MRRRRHLLARLDRLIPVNVGGGVLFADDLKSGAVRAEDLPIGGAGYLLLGRPMTTEGWIRAYAPEQLDGWIRRGRIEVNRSWPRNTKV